MSVAKSLGLMWSVAEATLSVTLGRNVPKIFHPTVFFHVTAPTKPLPVRQVS